ncbi:vomeronasal type-1 receptor 4-like [Cricetulus griseus]|uniref:Vomeronasal type-1 receptor n=1 Tax=Cricetulus griseus TaxID=10029 RepID=A0A9J7GM23_CRIGR|nr:vomeronasal type-1 receptor 4-like [Cricetulus griseus]
MLPSNTILGVCLITQLCVGVTGNSLLFILYIYTSFFKPHFKKLMDSISMHLTIVNVLMVIFTLISHIMSFFGVTKFLDDAGCRAVLFIFRVSRGMSISTTAVLSTFQVITITPSNSRWAWLKPKLSKLTLSSLLCSWLINLLIYTYMVPMVIAKNNSTHFGNGYLDPYCQNKHFGNQNSGSFLSIIFIRDLFYVAIMMWTSLYMVTVLYRHRKRVQHLHSTSLSCQPSPERRATHNILLLVICFVFFYWLNNFITLSGFYVQAKIPNVEGINAILATCHPTICPFLLMKNNKLVWQLTSSFCVRKVACFQSILCV